MSRLFKLSVWREGSKPSSTSSMGGGDEGTGGGETVGSGDSAQSDAFTGERDALFIRHSIGRGPTFWLEGRDQTNIKADLNRRENSHRSPATVVQRPDRRGELPEIASACSNRWKNSSKPHPECTSRVRLQCRCSSFPPDMPSLHRSRQKRILRGKNSVESCDDASRVRSRETGAHFFPCTPLLRGLPPRRHVLSSLLFQIQI